MAFKESMESLGKDISDGASALGDKMSEYCDKAQTYYDSEEGQRIRENCKETVRSVGNAFVDLGRNIANAFRKK